MKKLIVVLPLVFLLAGCQTLAEFQASFNQNVAAIEAKVAAFIAKVKQNAPIVLADAQQAVTVACTLVPVIQSASSAIQANVSGVSDKVQSILVTANAYGNKASSACAAYSSSQASAVTPSAAINTTIAVWQAYSSAKAQISAAQAKVAAGL